MSMTRARFKLNGGRIKRDCRHWSPVARRRRRHQASKEKEIPVEVWVRASDVDHCNFQAAEIPAHPPVQPCPSLWLD